MGIVIFRFMVLVYVMISPVAMMVIFKWFMRDLELDKGERLAYQVCLRLQVISTMAAVVLFALSFDEVKAPIVKGIRGSKAKIELDVNR